MNRTEIIEECISDVPLMDVKNIASLINSYCKSTTYKNDEDAAILELHCYQTDDASGECIGCEKTFTFINVGECHWAKVYKVCQCNSNVANIPYNFDSYVVWHNDCDFDVYVEESRKDEKLNYIYSTKEVKKMFTAVALLVLDEYKKSYGSTFKLDMTLEFCGRVYGFTHSDLPLRYDEREDQWLDRLTDSFNEAVEDGPNALAEFIDSELYNLDEIVNVLNK